MSKRSPATASKRARALKTPAKAQRAKPAVLRSPKLVVEATLAQTPSSAHKREQASPGVEIPAAEFQASPVGKKRAAALEDELKRTMTYNASNVGLHSATVNMQAYQSRFLDMALANMQFAFELAHRLATIRSPLDIFGVTAEFTSKRIALFHKQVYQTRS
jgi:hypothetical protein